MLVRLRTRRTARSLSSTGTRNHRGEVVIAKQPAARAQKYARATSLAALSAAPAAPKLTSFAPSPSVSLGVGKFLRLVALLLLLKQR